MKNGFLQNINSLLAIILAAEKKEQEKYYEAVSSSASDSTKLMSEANARIKKLRDVINRLKDFHFEIMEILENDDILLVTENEDLPEANNEDCPEADNDESLIEKVCEALIVAKPFKFLSMDCMYVGINPTDLEEPYVKLSNSMYVSVADPADVVCKEILNKCGIEEHEHSLYFRRG